MSPEHELQLSVGFRSSLTKLALPMLTRNDVSRSSLGIAFALVGLAAISARAADGDAVPVEAQAVLGRFLGTWTTETNIRRLLPSEHEINTRGRGQCVTTLGGRYFEFRTETPGVGKEPGESELQVMTYDEDQQVYRQWVFSSDGYHHEATGAWNLATSTLRWTGTSGDETFVIDDHFVGSDQLAWTLTRTNAAGQVVQTIIGVLKKQQEKLTTEVTEVHREDKDEENHR